MVVLLIIVILVVLIDARLLLFSGILLHLLVLLVLLLPLGLVSLLLLLLVLLLLHPLGVSLIPCSLGHVLRKGWVKVGDQAEVPLQPPEPHVRQWKGNTKRPREKGGGEEWEALTILMKPSLGRPSADLMRFLISSRSSSPIMSTVPSRGHVWHHLVLAACPPHQRQHPPPVERGDDPSPHHVLIHQTLDRLEEGVNLLLISGDEAIALAHRCYFEVVTSVQS
jgi:hypothetical protein